MQSTGGFSMDPDLLACRKKVQGIIYQSVMSGRFSNQNMKLRAVEITEKLEELIFKESVSQEDYMSLTVPRIEQQILNIMKAVHGNSQQSSSSSSMAHNGSDIHSVSADNITMNNTNIASSLVQNTNTNVASSLVRNTNTNVPVGSTNNSMFTANGSSNLHGYRQTSADVSHGTGGNCNINNKLRNSNDNDEIDLNLPITEEEKHGEEKHVDEPSMF